MIAVTPDYVRLDIEEDRPFDEVTESVRTVLQICRVNQLPGALVVSKQHGLDWRSSMRVAIRFVAARWSVSDTRLALVVSNTPDSVSHDVREVAADAGFHCKVFDQEKDAIDWITGRVLG